MSWKIERRTLPIRWLTPEETDHLGFGRRIRVSRVQYLWFGRWWRSAKWYAIEDHRRVAEMIVTKKELAAYGIPIHGEGRSPSR